MLAVIPAIPKRETILRSITKAEAQAKLQAADQVQSFIRVLGFCGFGMGAPALTVDVKNGRIVRLRPLHFDWQYKPSDFNADAWKIEAAGQTFTPPMKTLVPPYHLAYKKRAYSPNRVKYPLKRVDWDPSGNRNPQNRGKSKFVRISWDEAISTIASELNRIKTTYGTLAIYNESGSHGECKNVQDRGATQRVMNLWGGNITVETRDPDSWEGWYWGAKHMWGSDMHQGMMATQDNVLVDVLQNTELCLFWSGDPEMSPWGWDGQMASVYCYWLKKAGKHVIYVTPGLNHGAAVHADKWIPVRPNTDVAMHLAIAYTWIKEGTYDKDYVTTHTFGFDDSSLPAGAPAHGSFKSYVMGDADGVPKTPKWAEEITGVPARIIKALAREWASKKTSTFHGNGGGMIRGPYSTEPGRGEVALLAMQGVGKPGVMGPLKMIEWGIWGDPNLPRGVVVPTAGAGRLAGMGITIPGINNAMIQKCLLSEAILTPPISWYGTTSCMAPVQDQFVQYKYPDTGNPEIHMWWTEACNQTTSWPGGWQMIQAYRSPKMEFLLVQVPWMEDECLYADMVLPVKTTFEDDIDITAEYMGGTYFTMCLQKQCIDAIGESKSDMEICEMVADKLGILDTFTTGMSHMDLTKAAYEHSGIQDYISWNDFQEKQYFVIPVDPNWAKVPRGFSSYYNMPEGSGLNTKSGKIEFYSQWLAENFPNDAERPPVLHYIASGVSHQESLSSPRAKDYPLLLVSSHVKWRVHSQHDDLAWLREIETCKVRGPDGYQYEPVWIHPTDAANRGIKSGDIVQIYNERGVVLGGAYITERIMPGSVWQDHAARQDPIADGIDRGGSNNLIMPYNTTSKNAAGLVGTGYLVEVKKADMESLKAQYPEAFSRPFDPATGPCPATSWVSG